MSVSSRNPVWTLAIVSVGLMLATIDLFIVNVAFPTLEQNFRGVHLSTLSWVLNGYTIVFAALLVPAGRVADRTSLKQSFLAGVVLFTVGSALCAAASGIGMLIGARLVQATGAAVMIPSSLGLLLAAYPPARRSAAVRTWAGMAGLSAALGPVLGGLLVTLDWRWIFLVNVPVGLAALVLGVLRLPAPAPHREPLPDLLGALALTAAISLVTLGLVKAPDWGWASATTSATLAGALVLLVGFGLRSARHPHPIVEHGLLRVPTFALSTIAVLLFTASFAALLLSILVWTQTVWGWSALRTGLAFAPGPLMVPLFSIGVGKLAPRVGAGQLAALGCASFALAGILRVLLVGLRADYLTAMLPSAILSGVGVGLALPTLTATATASLPPERFATGSAVVNMARQIGYTLGVAVLIAVLGTAHTPAGELIAYRRGWWVAAGLALAGAAVAALLIRRPAMHPAAATERGRTAPALPATTDTIGL